MSLCPRVLWNHASVLDEYFHVQRGHTYLRGLSWSAYGNNGFNIHIFSVHMDFILSSTRYPLSMLLRFRRTPETVHASGSVCVSDILTQTLKTQYNPHRKIKCAEYSTVDTQRVIHVVRGTRRPTTRTFAFFRQFDFSASPWHVCV